MRPGSRKPTRIALIDSALLFLLLQPAPTFATELPPVFLAPQQHAKLTAATLLDASWHWSLHSGRVGDGGERERTRKEGGTAEGYTLTSASAFVDGGSSGATLLQRRKSIPLVSIPVNVGDDSAKGHQSSSNSTALDPGRGIEVEDTAEASGLRSEVSSSSIKGTHSRSSSLPPISTRTFDASNSTLSSNSESSKPVPTSHTPSNTTTRLHNLSEATPSLAASSHAPLWRTVGRAVSTSSSPPSSATPRTLGNGSAPLSCTPPPFTFRGTAMGFEGLCQVSYCPAPPVKNMAWNGNSGQVTRQEIETALGMLANVEPVLENGIGNVLSDGELGQAAYNAGLLFELSGDRRALDFAVKYADNMLALRNNPGNGTIMWNGIRELVWPTFPLPPYNTSIGQYAGSENGDIVGHMVNPALYILKSPCLWGLVPAPYEGPTAFAATDTYLTRALTFVRAGDETVDTYFIKWFLDENLLLIQPNDTRWLLVDDASNLPGAPMPWNRRHLLLHSFLRLAAAHETLPVYDPVRVWTYDNIVRRNIKDFIAHLTPTETDMGAPTFIWNYVKGKNNTEESKGVHGYYDILGLWMAWQRSPYLNGVTTSIAMALANTMQFKINLGNGTFSGLIDGTSTSSAPSVPGLWGGKKLAGQPSFYPADGTFLLVG
ncbi:hypothetical protein P7C70_g7235, partial [Phenoliferia sp. Uapishka_3]